MKNKLLLISSFLLCYVHIILPIKVKLNNFDNKTNRTVSLLELSVNEVTFETTNVEIAKFEPNKFYRKNEIELENVHSLEENKSFYLSDSNGKFFLLISISFFLDYPNKTKDQVMYTYIAPYDDTRKKISESNLNLSNYGINVQTDTTVYIDIELVEKQLKDKGQPEKESNDFSESTIKAWALGG